MGFQLNWKTSSFEFVIPLCICQSLNEAIVDERNNSLAFASVHPFCLLQNIELMQTQLKWWFQQISDWNVLVTRAARAVCFTYKRWMEKCSASMILTINSILEYFVYSLDANQFVTFSDTPALRANCFFQFFCRNKFMMVMFCAQLEMDSTQAIKWDTIQMELFAIIFFATNFNNDSCII